MYKALSFCVPNFIAFFGLTDSKMNGVCRLIAFLTVVWLLPCSYCFAGIFKFIVNKKCLIIEHVLQVLLKSLHLSQQMCLKTKMLCSDVAMTDQMPRIIGSSMEPPALDTLMS